MIIARVEQWETDEDGFAVNSEMDAVYFLARTGRTLHWFDENLKVIGEPKGLQNKRKLHRILNSEMNDTVECDGFDLDIIFYEKDVFPYNTYEHKDYGDLMGALI